MSILWLIFLLADNPHAPKQVKFQIHDMAQNTLRHLILYTPKSWTAPHYLTCGDLHRKFFFTPSGLCKFCIRGHSVWNFCSPIGWKYWTLCICRCFLVTWSKYPLVAIKLDITWKWNQFPKQKYPNGFTLAGFCLTLKATLHLTETWSDFCTAKFKLWDDSNFAVQKLFQVSWRCRMDLRDRNHFIF